MAASKKKPSTKSSSRKQPRPITRKTADKHILYQASVQAPEIEVDFMVSSYRALRKKQPMSMREDFCGTALLCATWVKSDPRRRATGVDLDPAVLAWGTKHNIEPLGEDAERVRLLEQNVLKKSPGKFDVINAMNFSYWIFRTRKDMLGYFKAVLGALNSDGVFVCDAYGGWEAQEPMLEPRRVKGGFTYVWDQDEFCPITHEIVNHIHFEFKDGTTWNKAFTYEWRYWTLPELRELLDEAGFSKVEVHWDVAPQNDEEDYRPVKRAENQAGWLAYLVAAK
ncbi:MAG TPA: class I SAM-dependent methyltransferase [Polyangiaceae bacterium]|nr:class I SAM-dependent methyltransferase [Polyangiaceae bacterium]